MFKNACMFCKVVGAIAIVGALNWGLVGVLQVNVIEMIFGLGISRLIYILVGLSGIGLLVSYFTACPICRK